ncbi:MAG TPA: peptide ABC transporter substrate-binding protein [Dehalococcoidia bacterium]|nr:peptide ABC transporter substrate-binding protein [Dehalococcoidia bacterium]
MLKRYRILIAAVIGIITCLSMISCGFLDLTCVAPHQREPSTLYLSDSGPLTLDPAISGEMSSHTYITQIFSGLFRLDDAMQPVGDLADTWERSQDGKIYVFHLKKEAKFHDGKPVTAQDFKYSWERACNPATESRTASTYLGDIVGAREMLQGKANTISGVQAIDDQTLKVTIDAPKAYFLAKLTYPTSFVVDRASVEKSESWWQQPNGTGPFKLKTWIEDQHIVLERNDSFYREPAKLTRIEFQLLAGSSMSLYETGDIDVAPVYLYDIDRAQDPKGPFAGELLVSPQLSLEYIGFNTQKPPFDDVYVRQAFCMAVHKEKIIKITQKGMVTNAHGILPPTMPGYNKDLKGFEFDVDKARALLAKSKYGNSLPPIIITQSGAGNFIPPYLGAIIQDWEQNLGATITVRQLDPEIFSYYLENEVDNMFVFGWIADYPDPQNFLDVLFNPEADYNYTKYKDPALTALLNQAGTHQDSAARYKLYQEAERILIDNAICLPLWFDTDYTLIKPYVKNYKLDAQGTPTLSSVFLDE